MKMNSEQINNFQNLANQFLGSFSEIAVPLANNLNINGMNNLCTIPYSTINDTLNNIKICVVIPGVAKESIQIRYNSNILTVEGKTSISGNDWMHLSEKTYKKSFDIGKGYRNDSISTTYVDGVLKIVINKQNNDGINIPVN